jgi:hypothetical protein
MSIRLRLTLFAFGTLLYIRQYQDTLEIEKRFL